MLEEYAPKAMVIDFEHRSAVLTLKSLKDVDRFFEKYIELMNNKSHVLSFMISSYDPNQISNISSNINENRNIKTKIDSINPEIVNLTNSLDNMNLNSKILIMKI